MLYFKRFFLPVYITSLPFCNYRPAGGALTVPDMPYTSQHVPAWNLLYLGTDIAVSRNRHAMKSKNLWNNWTRCLRIPISCDQTESYRSSNKTTKSWSSPVLLYVCCPNEILLLRLQQRSFELINYSPCSYSCEVKQVKTTAVWRLK